MLKRKSRRIFILLSGWLSVTGWGYQLTAAAQPQEEVQAENAAEAQAQSTPGMRHVATPEGKVLPQGVGRFRYVHKTLTGHDGFDSNGKRANMGLERFTAVHALVAEYGITEQLSFRFLAPIVYRNQLTMNQSKFEQSATYKEKYGQFVDKIAQKYADLGLCEFDKCRDLIDRGDLYFPEDTEITLPTGEQLSVYKNDSIRSSIKKFIMNSGTPPKNGPTGLSDIEIGLLYNIIKTEQSFISAGLGTRLPTGKFSVPEMKRPISGGVQDLGLRFNADYAPVDGLWLSFQQQFEVALTTAKWKRASLIENNKFNYADPNDGGDSESNTRTYEKRGVKTSSSARVIYGFGVLHPSLKSLSTSVSYFIDKDRAIFLDGKEYSKAPENNTVVLGGSVSGLPYRIPVDVEVNYNKVVSGRNVRLASDSLDIMLKLYARF